MKKKRKTWVVVLCVIAAVILVGAGAVYAGFTYLYGRSHYVSDATVSKETDSAAIAAQVDSNGLTQSEEEELRAKAQQAQEAITAISSNGIYNLLLAGVDRRDDSWYGNSDSMILLSVNTNTKKIHMISFMRDLYADIDGYGINKLNAACAIGGCPLLVSTIEKNYGVQINNYASVDFQSMRKIIDLFGGIDLTMSDDEAAVANDYIRSMCKDTGEDPTQYLLPSGGTYHLNGIQAVGYARDRYVGNSDYQRTERQREVLSLLIEKVKTMNAAQITSLANDVLPYVTHNVDQGTVLSLLTQVPTYASYTLETSRVPYDDLYTVKKEILVPDFTATIQKIQDEINS